jgi:hypothetical protein
MPEMSAPTGDVDIDYAIGRGRELRGMARIGRGEANAAEKVALLAAEVADALEQHAEQGAAVTLTCLPSTRSPAPISRWPPAWVSRM